MEVIFGGYGSIVLIYSMQVLICADQPPLFYRF